MSYTTVDDPSVYFQVALYTGNGNSTNAITNDGNSDLQPDWVWVKRREGASDHVLQDSSRGFSTTTKLASSSTQHENDTNSGGSFGITDPQWGYISSVSSDGFNANVGTGTGDQVNKTSSTYVGWQWKANAGTTASNSDGDISSTVQANTTAGFSIVTYTGNFTGTQTVGHGLGVRPDMVIIKNRDTAVDWVVWFSSLTSGNFMKLNDSVAESSSSRIFQNGFTTSTFGIGANNSVNKSSDDLVAYCFNNVQGFSKCGAYEGNGQRDGVFVYLGFQPAFVMIKNMDNSGRWTMFDNKRTIANGDFEYLVADDDHGRS